MAAISDRPLVTGYTEADWQDYTQTGPDTLNGRFLRRFWHPIHVAADLPAGRAKPIRIMSEDLTLYRGESGDAHLLAFRCAHRGTQLSTGWVEGDEIRCFYHGWKYDGAGQCTEQPAEPEPFCSRIRIRSYPTQEYLGLVWAYLGEDEPPALPRYTQMERQDDGPIDVRGGNILPMSYANALENDPAHVPFVHREAGHAQEIPVVQSEETEYGVRDFMPNVKVLNRYVHRIMPNGKALRAFTAFPRELGYAEALNWMVPVDDEHYMGFGMQKLHMTPEGVEKFHETRPPQRPDGAGSRTSVIDIATQALRGEFDIHSVDRTTPNVVNLQDLVTQWGQGTVRSRTGEHLGRTDVGVLLLRTIWQRELQALAEGRPLKQWTLPDHFEHFE